LFNFGELPRMAAVLRGVIGLVLAAGLAAGPAAAQQEVAPEDTVPAETAAGETANAETEAAEPDATDTAALDGWGTLSGDAPLIIAHRGASGALPEHTLEAYELAIEQGAEVIEPDLVMTRDGVLVARHDLFLSTTTDVADRPEFADRQTRRDGRNDWWVADFTLAEIKTLRARQPRADRPDDFDGRFEIPTFAEVIALAKDRSSPGAPIWVYPEAKAPEAHAEAGLDMEEALVAALSEAGWTGSDAPVYVQSFDREILERLDARIDTPLVQLVYPLPLLDLVGLKASNIGLARIAGYADGVGPAKTLVLTPEGEPRGFVEKAHALGLFVHPWTFRDDTAYGDLAPEDELRAAFAAGVDGVFTDFPATAVEVRAGLDQD
jgi:glycerophosphoryl diester phosphodiesterase